MMPFRLVDPPEGQAQVVAETLEVCTFPWWRILPAARADDDGAVLIRWTSDLPQGTTGTYDPWGMRISLDHPMDPHFVLAHELGHLADNESLTDDEHAELADLFHASEGTYRNVGRKLNGVEYAWSHRQPHDDSDWRGHDDPYLFRQGEAFADIFVAAFCPAYAREHPRFVHHTDDLDAVRDIVLRRDIQVFDDVDTDHPHSDGIRWAAEHGLASGYDDGTFRPDEPVTRGQLVSILHAYDRQKG